jgi:hypothetical protein
MNIELERYTSNRKFEAKLAHAKSAQSVNHEKDRQFI